MIPICGFVVSQFLILAHYEEIRDETLGGYMVRHAGLRTRIVVALCLALAVPTFPQNYGGECQP